MGTRSVWLGPPGSGKTTRVLDFARGRLRRFDGGFRVIVPSATMAEHLRNRLAREGFALRTDTVVTVAAHAAELAPVERIVTAPALELYLNEILELKPPAGLLEARDMPGFVPLLAKTIEELASAGCDAYTWQGFLSLEVGSAPLFRAIGEAWLELQERCAREALQTRHEWLQNAARALRAGALPGVDTFFWDGFPRLAAAEIDLIGAQGERGDVTVTLPAWSGAARAGLIALRRRGFSIRRFEAVRAEPRRVLVKPATEDEEVNEIARRILDAHAGGKPWREIGVVVRGHAPYVPLLETAFERYGIPVRPYFASQLESHPVARLFSGAVSAALAGWPWEQTLGLIVSPAGIGGASSAAAKFEYLVREALPGSGLEGLLKIAAPVQEGEAIARFIAALARFSEWRSMVAAPRDWVQRLQSLSMLLTAPQYAGISAESIAIWRTRAAAVRAWLGAFEETAEMLPADPIALGFLVELAAPALSVASVPDPEFRRDAVHLIDVHEARQWELPVVFVCGLVEGQFPRASHPDPILGNELRGALRRRGISVRTRSDQDAEERFLFDIALSRATEELVLSYPLTDAKGELTLPAFAVGRLTGLNESPGMACDPRPRTHAPARPAGAPSLQERRSLDQIRAGHPSFTPTGLESFLECPFQFFAGKLMELAGPPRTPAERFDELQRGSLVHKLLAQYHRLDFRQDLLALFAADWARTQAKLRVPPGYRLELERGLIERSLRLYAKDPPRQPGWTAYMEDPFQLSMAELTGDAASAGVEIKGRIDRYEVSPGGECVVYDYKFSRPSSVKAVARKQSERALQAGMYLLAVRHKGLRPIGFYYLALKGACEVTGWSEAELLDERANSAATLAGRAVSEILAGRIEVAPIDRDSCKFCDYADACRIREIGYPSERRVMTAGEGG